MLLPTPDELGPWVFNGSNTTRTYNLGQAGWVFTLEPLANTRIDTVGLTSCGASASITPSAGPWTTSTDFTIANITNANCVLTVTDNPYYPVTVNVVGPSTTAATTASVNLTDSLRVNAGASHLYDNAGATSWSLTANDLQWGGQALNTTTPEVKIQGVVLGANCGSVADATNYPALTAARSLTLSTGVMCTVTVHVGPIVNVIVTDAADTDTVAGQIKRAAQIVAATGITGNSTGTPWYVDNMSPVGFTLEYNEAQRFATVSGTNCSPTGSGKNWSIIENSIDKPCTITIDYTALNAVTLGAKANAASPTGSWGTVSIPSGTPPGFVGNTANANNGTTLVTAPTSTVPVGTVERVTITPAAGATFTPATGLAMSGCTYSGSPPWAADPNTPRTAAVVFDVRVDAACTIDITFGRVLEPVTMHVEPNGLTGAGSLSANAQTSIPGNNDKFFTVPNGTSGGDVALTVASGYRAVAIRDTADKCPLAAENTTLTGAAIDGPDTSHVIKLGTITSPCTIGVDFVRLAIVGITVTSDVADAENASATSFTQDGTSNVVPVSATATSQTGTLIVPYGSTVNGVWTPMEPKYRLLSVGGTCGFGIGVGDASKVITGPCDVTVAYERRPKITVVTESVTGGNGTIANSNGYHGTTAAYPTAEPGITSTPDSGKTYYVTNGSAASFTVNAAVTPETTATINTEDTTCPTPTLTQTSLAVTPTADCTVTIVFTRTPHVVTMKASNPAGWCHPSGAGCMVAHPRGGIVSSGASIAAANDPAGSQSLDAAAVGTTLSINAIPDPGFQLGQILSSNTCTIDGKIERGALVDYTFTTPERAGATVTMSATVAEEDCDVHVTFEPVYTEVTVEVQGVDAANENAVAISASIPAWQTQNPFTSLVPGFPATEGTVGILAHANYGVVFDLSVAAGYRAATVGPIVCEIGGTQPTIAGAAWTPVDGPTTAATLGHFTLLGGNATGCVLPIRYTHPVEVEADALGDITLTAQTGDARVLPNETELFSTTVIDAGTSASFDLAQEGWTFTADAGSGNTMDTIVSTGNCSITTNPTLPSSARYVDVTVADITGTDCVITITPRIPWSVTNTGISPTGLTNVAVNGEVQTTWTNGMTNGGAFGAAYLTISQSAPQDAAGGLEEVNGGVSMRLAYDDPTQTWIPSIYNWTGASPGWVSEPIEDVDGDGQPDRVLTIDGTDKIILLSSTSICFNDEGDNTTTCSTILNTPGGLDGSPAHVPQGADRQMHVAWRWIPVSWESTASWDARYWFALAGTGENSFNPASISVKHRLTPPASTVGATYLYGQSASGVAGPYLTSKSVFVDGQLLKPYDATPRFVRRTYVDGGAVHRIDVPSAAGWPILGAGGMNSSWLSIVRIADKAYILCSTDGNPAKEITSACTGITSVTLIDGSGNVTTPTPTGNAVTLPAANITTFILTMGSGLETRSYALATGGLFSATDGAIGSTTEATVRIGTQLQLGLSSSAVKIPRAIDGEITIVDDPLTTADHDKVTITIPVDDGFASFNGMTPWARVSAVDAEDGTLNVTVESVVESASAPETLAITLSTSATFFVVGDAYTFHVTLGTTTGGNGGYKAFDVGNEATLGFWGKPPIPWTKPAVVTIEALGVSTEPSGIITDNHATTPATITTTANPAVPVTRKMRTGDVLRLVPTQPEGASTKDYAVTRVFSSGGSMCPILESLVLPSSSVQSLTLGTVGQPTVPLTNACTLTVTFGPKVSLIATSEGSRTGTIKMDYTSAGIAKSVTASTTDGATGKHGYIDTQLADPAPTYPVITITKAANARVKPGTLSAKKADGTSCTSLTTAELLAIDGSVDHDSFTLDVTDWKNCTVEVTYQPIPAEVTFRATGPESDPLATAQVVADNTSGTDWAPQSGTVPNGGTTGLVLTSATARSTLTFDIAPTDATTYRMQKVGGIVQLKYGTDEGSAVAFTSGTGAGTCSTLTQTSVAGCLLTASAGMNVYVALEKVPTSVQILLDAQYPPGTQDVDATALLSSWPNGWTASQTDVGGTATLRNDAAGIVFTSLTGATTLTLTPSADVAGLYNLVPGAGMMTPETQLAATCTTACTITGISPSHVPAKTITLNMVRKPTSVTITNLHNDAGQLNVTPVTPEAPWTTPTTTATLPLSNMNPANVAVFTQSQGKNAYIFNLAPVLPANEIVSIVKAGDANWTPCTDYAACSLQATPGTGTSYTVTVRKRPTVKLTVYGASTNGSIMTPSSASPANSTILPSISPSPVPVILRYGQEASFPVTLNTASIPPNTLTVVSALRSNGSACIANLQSLFVSGTSSALVLPATMLVDDCDIVLSMMPIQKKLTFAVTGPMGDDGAVTVGYSSAGAPASITMRQGHSAVILDPADYEGVDAGTAPTFTLSDIVAPFSLASVTLKVSDTTTYTATPSGPTFTFAVFGSATPSGGPSAVTDNDWIVTLNFAQQPTVDAASSSMERTDCRGATFDRVGVPCADGQAITTRVTAAFTMPMDTSATPTLKIGETELTSIATTQWAVNGLSWVGTAHIPSNTTDGSFDPAQNTACLSKDGSPSMPLDEYYHCTVTVGGVRGEDLAGGSPGAALLQGEDVFTAIVDTKKPSFDAVTPPVISMDSGETNYVVKIYTNEEMDPSKGGVAWVGSFISGDATAPVYTYMKLSGCSTNVGGTDCPTPTRVVPVLGEKAVKVYFTHSLVDVGGQMKSYFGLGAEATLTITPDGSETANVNVWDDLAGNKMPLTTYTIVFPDNTRPTLRVAGIQRSGANVRFLRSGDQAVKILVSASKPLLLGETAELCFETNCTNTRNLTKTGDLQYVASFSTVPSYVDGTYEPKRFYVKDVTDSSASRNPPCESALCLIEGQAIIDNERPASPDYPVLTWTKTDNNTRGTLLLTDRSTSAISPGSLSVTADLAGRCKPDSAGGRTISGTIPLSLRVADVLTAQPATSASACDNGYPAVAKGTIRIWFRVSDEAGNVAANIDSHSFGDWFYEDLTADLTQIVHVGYHTSPASPIVHIKASEFSPSACLGSPSVISYGDGSTASCELKVVVDSVTFADGVPADAIQIVMRRLVGGETTASIPQPTEALGNGWYALDGDAFAAKTFSGGEYVVNANWPSDDTGGDEAMYAIGFLVSRATTAQSLIVVGRIGDTPVTFDRRNPGAARIVSANGTTLPIDGTAAVIQEPVGNITPSFEGQTENEANGNVTIRIRRAQRVTAGGSTWTTDANATVVGTITQIALRGMSFSGSYIVRLGSSILTACNDADIRAGNIDACTYAVDSSVEHNGRPGGYGVTRFVTIQAVRGYGSLAATNPPAPITADGKERYELSLAVRDQYGNRIPDAKTGCFAQDTTSGAWSLQTDCTDARDVLVPDPSPNTAPEQRANIDLVQDNDAFDTSAVLVGQSGATFVPRLANQTDTRAGIQTGWLYALAPSVDTRRYVRGIDGAPTINPSFGRDVALDLDLRFAIGVENATSLEDGSVAGVTITQADRDLYAANHAYLKSLRTPVGLYETCLSDPASDVRCLYLGDLVQDPGASTEDPSGMQSVTALARDPAAYAIAPLPTDPLAVDDAGYMLFAPLLAKQEWENVGYDQNFYNTMKPQIPTVQIRPLVESRIRQIAGDEAGTDLTAQASIAPNGGFERVFAITGSTFKKLVPVGYDFAPVSADIPKMSRDVVHAGSSAVDLHTELGILKGKMPFRSKGEYRVELMARTLTTTPDQLVRMRLKNGTTPIELTTFYSDPNDPPTELVLSPEGTAQNGWRKYASTFTLPDLEPNAPPSLMLELQSVTGTVAIVDTLRVYPLTVGEGTRTTPLILGSATRWQVDLVNRSATDVSIDPLQSLASLNFRYGTAVWGNFVDVTIAKCHPGVDPNHPSSTAPAEVCEVPLTVNDAYILAGTQDVELQVCGDGGLCTVEAGVLASNPLPATYRLVPAGNWLRVSFTGTAGVTTTRVTTTQGLAETLVRFPIAASPLAAFQNALAATAGGSEVRYLSTALALDIFNPMGVLGDQPAPSPLVRYTALELAGIRNDIRREVTLATRVESEANVTADCSDPDGNGAISVLARTTSCVALEAEKRRTFVALGSLASSFEPNGLPAKTLASNAALVSDLDALKTSYVTLEDRSAPLYREKSVALFPGNLVLAPDVGDPADAGYPNRTICEPTGSHTIVVRGNLILLGDLRRTQSTDQAAPCAVAAGEPVTESFGIVVLPLPTPGFDSGVAGSSDKLPGGSVFLSPEVGLVEGSLYAEGAILALEPEQPYSNLLTISSLDEALAATAGPRIVVNDDNRPNTLRNQLLFTRGHVISIGNTWGGAQVGEPAERTEDARLAIDLSVHRVYQLDMQGIPLREGRPSPGVLEYLDHMRDPVGVLPKTIQTLPPLFSRVGSFSAQEVANPE